MHKHKVSKLEPFGNVSVDTQPCYPYACDMTAIYQRPEKILAPPMNRNRNRVFL